MAPLSQVLFVVGYVAAILSGLAWLWWVPLALTLGDVISALAAFGSVGAVWAAVDVSRRSERVQRRKDAAKVVSLRVLANGLASVAEYRMDPANLNPGSDVMRTSMILNDLRVIFDNIVVSDLPSAKSVDLYMLISTKLHMLCRLAHELESGSMPKEAAAAIFALARTDLYDYGARANVEAIRLESGD